MGFNSNLPDNRLIHEGYGKNPFPMWIWFFVIVAIIAVVWGSGSWWMKERNVEISSKPFLQVTNRQFSLFLWQFPQYMRANYKSKTGYLEAFQALNGVSATPSEVDQWVQAPPEIIFLYHNWERLLKDSYFPRPIPRTEFIEFLNQVEIWKPEFWTKAPESYKKLVKGLAQSDAENLDTAAMAELPIEVSIAFQGWRNYFKEGDQINKLKPTYSDMQAFLVARPNYARNYWKNILQESRPNYLSKEGEPSAVILDDQLDGFLKVAFFNYTMARQSQ